MVINRNQSQSTLEILSLTTGMMLGGLAAVLVIGFLIGYSLQAGGANLHLANLLPAGWQAALVAQARAMGFPLQGETPAYWYMSRASALLGYLLLWASTVWGLLLSTKIAKSVLSPVLTFSVHEFLSLLGLGFATFHAFILLGDRYIAFTLRDILLPFSAGFEPLWVGVGTLSLYLYALITFSFYIRKKIGQQTWRTLHYLTFGLYGMVVAHSLLLGTDSGSTAMQGMYLASAASVLFLVYYRILDSAGRSAKKRAGKRA